MTIIVENGTGVAGANSYATVAQLIAYAALRGVTLPALEADKELLLIKAMDYIEARTARFQGGRILASQLLSWPRWGVWLFGEYFLENAIPAQLVEAQLEIAMRSQGVELLPAALPTDKVVIEESVGPLSVKYADPEAGIGTSSLPLFPKAEALLAQLFRPAGLAVRKA